MFGEKLLKDIFWQKWWFLKAMKLKKLKNVNFAHFVIRPLDLFWEKWELLKAMKLKKLEKPNFTHFVDSPRGENVHKSIF